MPTVRESWITRLRSLSLPVLCAAAAPETFAAIYVQITRGCTALADRSPD